MNETTRPLDWLVLLLVVAAAYTLLPLWAPLVLAAWFAALLSGAMQRLSPEKHRKRSAALLTTALTVAVLIPLALLTVSLATAAAELARGVLQSQNQSEAIKQMILGGEPGPLSLDSSQILQLFRRYWQSAASALGAVAGATTKAVIGAIVFVVTTYAFLVDGQRLYRWLAERVPLRRAYCDRLAAAFVETGRGLLIGTGLTALIQGALATVGYFALGIPRALVLGFLTSLASLIPSVGTGLVWVPVSAVLAMTGRYAAAIVMLAIGALVSVADNFIRPALSRRGALRLPTMVVFVAMLGGIGVFGGWGLVLGPLFTRLAVEGLEIHRDSRRAAAKLPRRPPGAAGREPRPS